jgi:uroporphyrinogen decarboxylase
LKKGERITAALRGEEVDRPPFSFWYHFGLQHMSGSGHAQAEIDFFRAYDLDFLKVMSDYPYPLPSGIDEVARPDDWGRIEPLEASDRCWGEQLTALSLINEAIGKETLFIDTIFSPWTTARRLSGREGLTEARRRHPDLVLAAMENIATSLANYARAAVARGAAGIFMSLAAATHDLMSPEEYHIWGRPFDLKILEAVRDAPFNVLHIHGKQIHFDSLLDYPVSAINWSHFATKPSLAEGRLRWDRTVMGGVDEAEIAHMSVSEVVEQVKRSVSEVGPAGLILTPGCSVPTDTPERNLRAIKAALE